MIAGSLKLNNTWRSLGVFCISFFAYFVNQEAMLVAQLDFDQKPISYQTADAKNRVSDLQAEIDAGTVQLEFDDKHGYLRSVLRELEIESCSQMLVFSKTSFQLRK
ncbi:MAG: hypothetical protein AAGA30_22080, partial [Planctomycetota bacterium]